MYSEVTPDPETIAITMPNDAGDVMIVGAPGAAAREQIEADVEGGVSVRRETGDDGAFSLTIPGQTGQSISLKLDLPRCGCQSVTPILRSRVVATQAPPSLP